jgi:hypothetical protein
MGKLTILGFNPGFVQLLKITFNISPQISTFVWLDLLRLGYNNFIGLAGGEFLPAIFFSLSFVLFGGAAPAENLLWREENDGSHDFNHRG